MIKNPTFPNYLQIPSVVPRRAWHFARLMTIGLAYGIAITAFIRPQAALFIFWKMIIPILPVLFFVGPGIWRNICPMAALNQTPRLFRFSRALTAPDWLRNNAYLIGIVMFLIIVPTRKALFNSNGPALGLLLLFALTTPLIGGYFFKGKSGWCSSICPLLPVQRLYGQTPFVRVPNNYCQPCVGCAKNCYDFNPNTANLADQYDPDRRYSGYRRFFAGTFPGLIAAFYLTPDPPKITVQAMYLQIIMFVLISLGIFLILDTFLKASSFRITTLFGAIALNYYYVFNIPSMANTIHHVFGVTLPTWVLWGAHLTIFALSSVWIFRTYRKERLYVRKSVAQSSEVRSSRILTNSIIAHQSKIANHPEVNFKSEGKRVLAAPGCNLLELAERNGMHLEAGCRMGVCGADPVAILDGMGNLSKISSDEQSTLDRLGLAENTRMACCARVKGPVTVSLKPEKPKIARSSSIIGFRYDPDIRHVVVIGNGIAGITAADHIRRRHPDCQIHVIGRENHHLYNRMGLARLIYGRSAMQGLYLMPDSWYDEHQITCWLNTHVSHIDAQAKTIELADGEMLPYDRLVLATGSRSTIPSIEGYGLPGSFVLREADDAMQIRHFAQKYGSRRAVVAGGGLLGLEAAYALHKFGLDVQVLERSVWPMRRQLDERGGNFLMAYLAAIGITVVTEAETAQVRGSERIEQVVLKDGRTLDCEIFLVCAGIKPNIELAAEAGILTKNGILVDDEMRTNIVDIFAAGDVAEYGGQVYGLWPIAVAQAETAAVNVVGGKKSYVEITPSTMLKVAGVDLLSVGQFEARSSFETEIVLEDEAQHLYRKLVIADGKIVGAILLGYPEHNAAVTAAIREQRSVDHVLSYLTAGNWAVLADSDEEADRAEQSAVVPHLAH
ncbi:MAG: FAD-dependent oxidoreductase [Anaerolineae bacterium]